MEEEEEVLDILQRWDSTGLLTGLPPWEKEELAIVYDNVTKIMLSMTGLNNDEFEVLSDVTLPTTRRLYRRVGVNFDVHNMMAELVKSVKINYHEIRREAGKDEHGNLINPVVDFCVQFADTYTDSEITRNTFTNEEYSERVTYLLDTLKTILLSDDMVSLVDRTNGEWNIKYSDVKKSPNQVRIWNQKRAIETLHGVLNETNQGI